MLVEYNRPNIHDAYGLKFKPGINDVDPKKWDECKKDPEIKRLIGENIFVEFLADKTAEGKKAAEAEVLSLVDFTESKAIKVVKKTYKLDMLSLWQAGETRQSVIVEIVRQIESIKAEMAKTNKK